MHAASRKHMNKNGAQRLFQRSLIRPISPHACHAVPSPVKDAPTRTHEPPRRAQRRPEDLNDPAKIGAKGQSRVEVSIPESPQVSLDQYMLLPVEQYFVLDPKQIRHLGSNRFQLLVPRINILNVWLEPEVDIIVTTYKGVNGGPPKVVLQAENCRIRGSDMIENLKLDQRFCMRFTTELTWQSSPRTSPSLSLTPLIASSASGSSIDTSLSGSISGDAVLEVWCEVIPPFNLMPREALQSTCNAVMYGLVNTLLPLFLRNLGRDFEKWSREPEYRAERARRSNPLV